VAKLLHVLDVGAGIDGGVAVGAAFAAEFQNTGAEAAKKHAIMRYEDHGALQNPSERQSRSDTTFHGEKKAPGDSRRSYDVQ
jgi:hypothetical protein